MELAGRPGPGDAAQGGAERLEDVLALARREEGPPQGLGGETVHGDLRLLGGEDVRVIGVRASGVRHVGCGGGREGRKRWWGRPVATREKQDEGNETLAGAFHGP